MTIMATIRNLFRTNTATVKVASKPRGRKARSRVSSFAGQTIVALCDTNPRKPGSHGYNAYEVILAAGGEIRYETYRQLGCDPRHLRWDIDHGFAVIKGRRPKAMKTTWGERELAREAREIARERVPAYKPSADDGHWVPGTDDFVHISQL